MQEGAVNVFMRPCTPYPRTPRNPWEPPKKLKERQHDENCLSIMLCGPTSAGVRWPKVAPMVPKDAPLSSKGARLKPKGCPRGPLERPTHPKHKWSTRIVANRMMRANLRFFWFFWGERQPRKHGFRSFDARCELKNERRRKSQLSITPRCPVEKNTCTPSAHYDN